MKISDIKVRPFVDSIFPALSFRVEIGYKKYQEAIVGINGWLETDDKKIIAEINEILEERRNEIGAKGSSFDSEFKEGRQETTIIAFLDKRALDYIEKRRMKDRKGDVRLILNLNVESIENKALISPIYGWKPKKAEKLWADSKKELILRYVDDPKFSSKSKNKWILSGMGSPVFLLTKKQIIRKERTIKSSDWIHDYAPKLGLGEYFIVEIPRGKKIIEKAWNYMEKAEECFRRWDTKGVYANCREAGSLLDKAIKDKFGKDSFVYDGRWGRTYKRFKNLSFSDFASLDLHLEDIKKSQKYSLEEVKIGNADAEHILIVTKALTKYAEELLQEKGFFS